MSLSGIFPIRTTAVLWCVLFLSASACSACSEDGPQLAPDPDVAPDVIIFVPDKKGGETDTGTPPPACELLWQNVLTTSGASSHPALGKSDRIYVSSGQKAYALDGTPGNGGATIWIWPDGDPAQPPSPGELYSPVLGKEDILYMGTNAAKLLALDKQGTLRFLFDVQGSVSGAPALATAIDDPQIRNDVIVVTDEGAAYRVRDKGANKFFALWGLEGDEALANPKPGIQPIIGPASIYGEETALILTLTSLEALKAGVDGAGASLWSYPLPVGYEAVSNPIMEADGAIAFLAGTEPTPPNFKTTYLMRVAPDGTAGEGNNALVYDSTTRAVSLSQGLQNTLLIGTENAGILAFDQVGNKLLWHFIAPEQNFETVAQPVQDMAGFVYFGAARHWLYAVDQVGEPLWHQKLDGPGADLGAIMWPGSPLVMSNGTVIYHNSLYVYAVQCSDSGPTALPWPRFGGNDRNTGNIGDKLQQ